MSKQPGAIGDIDGSCALAELGGSLTAGHISPDGSWAVAGQLGALSGDSSLFLLGIVLAEAFLQTGTVYYSIGLHAGFVVGAKLWPDLTSAGVRLPAWLTGWGPQPLISGVAAWAIAPAPLALVRPLTRANPA